MPKHEAYQCISASARVASLCVRVCVRVCVCMRACMLLCTVVSFLSTRSPFGSYDAILIMYIISCIYGCRVLRLQRKKPLVYLIRHVHLLDCILLVFHGLVDRRCDVACPILHPPTSGFAGLVQNTDVCRQPPYALPKHVSKVALCRLCAQTAGSLYN